MNHKTPPTLRTIIQLISTGIGYHHSSDPMPGVSQRAHLDNWGDLLDTIEKEYLLSGSGFDAGTTIDRDKSTPQKIVLNTSFHHMSEHGYYLKWSEHQIIITPTFDGFDLVVKGRDFRDIKEYIGETFDAALSDSVEFIWNVEQRRLELGPLKVS